MNNACVIQFYNYLYTVNILYNMKKKIIRLTEQDFHNILNECVTNILKEDGRDIDQDNYYGGGLPDNYNKEDAPESNEVDYNLLSQLSAQLSKMVSTLFSMANNSDGNTDWLFSIAYQLEKGEQTLDAFIRHNNKKQ